MRKIKRIEALWSGSSVTLRDKEPNAFRNLARLTPLVSTHASNKNAHNVMHTNTLGRKSSQSIMPNLTYTRTHLREREKNDGPDCVGAVDVSGDD